MEQTTPTIMAIDAIELAIQPSPRMAKADERFMLFLRRTPMPITEDAIAAFYAEFVMRYGAKEDHEWYTDPTTGQRDYRYILVEYTENQIREYSLNWFDRSLGRAIRKKILAKQAKLILDPNP